MPTVRIPSGALLLPHRALDLEDLPASASPQARAARPAPILDRVTRALVIDLGPLPDFSHPAEQDKDTPVPQGHRIGIHRPLPREFRGNLAPHLDWTADADGRHSTEITFSGDGAVSLRVAVQATLPHGASVRVFDGAGQPRGPAFTPADFEASGNLPLWLPSAEGDRLTVRIVLSSVADVEALSFTVPSVAHRFASVVPQSHPYGHGLCHDHVDLACVSSPLVHETADAVGKLRFCALREAVRPTRGNSRIEGTRPVRTSLRPPPSRLANLDREETRAGFPYSFRGFCRSRRTARRAGRAHRATLAVPVSSLDFRGERLRRWLPRGCSVYATVATLWPFAKRSTARQRRSCRRDGRRARQDVHRCQVRELRHPG